MKACLVSSVLFSIVMAHTTTAVGQGVYVTPGDQGPVFSDKPQRGAKEVTLPPLTIVAPPKKTKASKEAKSAAPEASAPAPDSPKPDAAVVGYRLFSVVSPENNGSVVANTAVFEVRVAVDPSLQLGVGHAFVVSINGRPVGQRYTATEFMIPPEFWGDTLPPANQSLLLEASIVDGVGQVLKTAPPVWFFMRHASLTNRPKRPVHVPVAPLPEPKARPALEPAKKINEIRRD